MKRFETFALFGFMLTVQETIFKASFIPRVYLHTSRNSKHQAQSYSNNPFDRVDVLVTGANMFTMLTAHDQQTDNSKQTTLWTRV